jgi:Tol biopolymer transport system component
VTSLRHPATLAVVLVAAAACGPPQPIVEPETPAPAVAPSGIVATERATGGGHLVFVGHTGDRLAHLTTVPTGSGLYDASPVWSPDGRWIAFVSNRGRADPLHTSVWAIEARPGAQARRLTFSESVDRDPRWLPDGSALVFSSMALTESASFDLYRLDVRHTEHAPVPAGGARALTSGPAHALSPTISPDGTEIIYMVLDYQAGHQTLWRARIDGTGAAEIPGTTGFVTPSWSPDGATVAVAIEAPEAGRIDADLHLMNPDGTEVRRLLDEPLGDQTGPVWSADGRFLFCVSVFRSTADAGPLLSSITFLDLREEPLVLRALHDRVAVESRVSATIAPSPLDPVALAGNRSYAAALRETIEQYRHRDAP